MSHNFKLNFYELSKSMKIGIIALSLLLGSNQALAQSTPPVRAVLEINDPAHQLEKVLEGTRRATVMPLDKQGLSLFLNDQAEGVMLEGWNTKALSSAEADALLHQFGVRVTWDETKGTSQFLVPKDVGRAGVLEGETFFKLNGKVFKGLTIKGYGAILNNPFGEQPVGSMDLGESYRDMEMSKILTEAKVDTYLGVLIVERPNQKANYIRLSRTALRMDSITKMKDPAKMATLVDYFTDLMTEEMGRKLSFGEFNEWLVKHTADLMARKDYARFAHASITIDNLGIGELVDLGDNWGATGMIEADGTYKAQNGRFKQHVWDAEVKLMAAERNMTEANVQNQLRGEFDKLYDESYDIRLKALHDFDRARINLNTASLDDLKGIGFTQTEAAEILKLNGDLPDGILDPRELESVKNFAKKMDTILDKTTTDFMKLSDGSELNRYYVKNIGGAQGIREVLEKTRDYMKQNPMQVARDADGKIVVTNQVTQLKGAIAQFAVEHAKAADLKAVVGGESVTRFSKFIAQQVLEVIARR